MDSLEGLSKEVLILIAKLKMLDIALRASRGNNDENSRIEGNRRVLQLVGEIKGDLTRMGLETNNKPGRRYNGPRC
jgi:hypothetical protein